MRTLGLGETNTQDKSHDKIKWKDMKHTLAPKPKMKPILFSILCLVLCQNLSCEDSSHVWRVCGLFICAVYVNSCESFDMCASTRRRMLGSLHCRWLKWQLTIEAKGDKKV